MAIEEKNLQEEELKETIDMEEEAESAQAEPEPEEDEAPEEESKAAPAEEESARLWYSFWMSWTTSSVDLPANVPMQAMPREWN